MFRVSSNSNENAPGYNTLGYYVHKSIYAITYSYEQSFIQTEIPQSKQLLDWHFAYIAYS